jgi:phenylacetic acid degradation operon negative regulatory protein
VAPDGDAIDTESLQPQELVITLFGAYVRSAAVPVWSGGLVRLLGELGFTQGAARVALTRLVRRGLLERDRSGRLVHYRMTSRCERLLAEGDRRIFTLGDSRNGASDGWTLLWHQIPEARRLERSRLARRLRFLGFGSVQDSVWVSPHDHVDEVVRLLAELDVAAFATVFLASVGSQDGISALVERAWDLSGLAARYASFDDEFARYRARGVSLSDPEAFRVRTRLMHLFRQFPFVDPELPRAQVSVSRARARAVRTFHVLYKRLAPAAQRHFEAVTDAYAGRETRSRVKRDRTPRIPR